MDLLTLTVLAEQQPRRAVQSSPQSMVHWCARCWAASPLAAVIVGDTHLPFADFRVHGFCVECRVPLVYNDL